MRGLTWRVAAIEAVHPATGGAGAAPNSLSTDARASKVSAIRCLAAPHDDDYDITLARLQLRHRAFLDFLEWVAWSEAYKHFDTSGDVDNDLDIYELREAFGEWIADTDRLHRAHRRPALDTGDPDDAGFAVAVSHAVLALVDGGDGGGQQSIARTMSAVRRYVKVFGDWAEWLPACGLSLLPSGGRGGSRAAYTATLDEYAVERAARSYVGLSRDAVRRGVSGRGTMGSGAGRGGAAGVGLHYSVRYEDGDVDRYIPESSVRPLRAATVRERFGARDALTSAAFPAGAFAASSAMRSGPGGRHARFDDEADVATGARGMTLSARTRGNTRANTTLGGATRAWGDRSGAPAEAAAIDPLAMLLSQTLGGTGAMGRTAGGSSLDPVSLALATALAAIVGGGSGSGGGATLGGAGGVTLQSNLFATADAGGGGGAVLTTPTRGDASIEARLGVAHDDAYVYALGEAVEVQPLAASAASVPNGWLSGIVAKARVDGSYDVALDRAVGQPWDEVERGLRPAQMRRTAGRGARAAVAAAGGASGVSFRSPAVRRAAAASGAHGGGGGGGPPPPLRVALFDPYPMQTRRAQAAARAQAAEEASREFGAKFINPRSKKARAATALKARALAASSRALVTSSRASTAQQKQDGAVHALVATLAALNASPRLSARLVSAADVKGNAGTRADQHLARDNFDVLLLGVGCGPRSRAVTAAEKGLGSMGVDSIRRFVSNGGGFVGIGGGGALAAVDYARGGLGLVAADVEPVSAQARRACAKAESDSAAARVQGWDAASAAAVAAAGLSGVAPVGDAAGRGSAVASSKSSGAVRVANATVVSSKTSGRATRRGPSTKVGSITAVAKAPLPSSKLAERSVDGGRAAAAASSKSAEGAAPANPKSAVAARAVPLALKTTAVAKQLATEGVDTESLLFAIEATSELGRSLLGVAGTSATCDVDGILGLHTLGQRCEGAILRERANVLTPQFRVVARFSGEMHWVAPSTSSAKALESGAALLLPRGGGAGGGKPSGAQRSIAVRTVNALVNGGDDAEYDLRTLRSLVAEYSAFIDDVAERAEHEHDEEDGRIAKDDVRRQVRCCARLESARARCRCAALPTANRSIIQRPAPLSPQLEDWIDERNRWDSGSIERAILRVCRAESAASGSGDGEDDDDAESGRFVRLKFMRTCERELEDFLGWISESASRWRAFDRRGDGSCVLRPEAAGVPAPRRWNDGLLSPRGHSSPHRTPPLIHHFCSASAHQLECGGDNSRRRGVLQRTRGPQSHGGAYARGQARQRNLCGGARRRDERNRAAPGPSRAARSCDCDGRIRA